ncbi:HIT family protein [Dactylosporangium sp. NPDC051541]|uniref:HIT family protein n=1 Tax=Dactylosporangium sp. NPDC051541 TaxID=3363977 RepID=UPI0037B935CD
MFNHEPDAYECSMCRLVAGGEDEHRSQLDIVRRDPLAMAFIAPRWWPKNHGHVLVVPNTHIENLYDLPADTGHAISDLTRDVATAIRHTYGCDGTSVRQHNEPAGNQHVWHYHMHVFPRYTDDNLYFTQPHEHFATADERLTYADKLRTHFAGKALRSP